MSELIDTLRGGGTAVMRTDTIYGVVGRADSKEVVEKIYQIKGRNPHKSPIVLIASVDQMYDRYDDDLLGKLNDFWPGPNTVILPSQAAPDWIKRDNGSVAYRLPLNAGLLELVRATGPLIAPSANPEGLPPAANITEAKTYFGDRVDFYQDGGTVVGQQASSLYRWDDGRFVQIR